MHQHNTLVSRQKWYDSAHASLCVLGVYLRQIGFFDPLEKRVHVQQKVLKYTAVQKLEMLFVGLLAGIKAVSHTATTVRVDEALTTAFGLPGCADQSVIAQTLDAATEADVADLAAAMAELFGRYSPTRQHAFDKEVLVLDVDVSPLPASRAAEGSERGYQVTGKFKSNGRVRKLVRGITAWSTTSSPGREVAPVPEPVEFVRSLSQYAVRTPSKEQASGYYHAVVFTSRTELTMTQVVDHYDGRAGIEADLKGDKHGLGLATIRKHRLSAQKMVILLMQLAHNVLLWARQWLSEAAPRLREYGIIRLIGQVWAIPGRLKLTDRQVQRIRLRPAHPRTHDVCRGFHPLLLKHHLEKLLR